MRVVKFSLIDTPNVTTNCDSIMTRTNVICSTGVAGQRVHGSELPSHDQSNLKISTDLVRKF